MRISEAWLHEWTAAGSDSKSLADRLSMAGLEVDALEPAAPPFSGVVVGEVLACEPHPNADKLQLCTVSDGTDSLDVVCGAPNARPGLRAPFATVGGVLPDGTRIHKAKLRGVESQGMLCSARELGLAEDAEGLLELPTDAPVGEDLRQYLELDDTIIEVDLTPNRGDCLGMAGVAREVGVLFRTPVTGPALEPVPATIEDRLPIELQSPEACPRYLGRVIKGIDAGARTPVWMRERLRRAGVRPLAVAVDVTNYVMLELGQPLHAFDYDRLQGGIRVRRAEAGEQLTLLGDQPVELDPDTLVIADHARPVAMAGVMGGADTAVETTTENIFLECAFFSPLAIAGRARSYGLHTDAAHRFERGVDWQLQHTAIERATALLVAIAGGEPGPVEEAVEPQQLPAERSVELRLSRLVKLLGTEIPDDSVDDILGRLGMAVTATQDGWHARVPSWRFDVSREEDLIEEIARVWGYDRLPLRHPNVAPRMADLPEERVGDRRLRSALADRDYLEAITYSFVDPRLQRLLAPEVEALPLANPISSDMAEMRVSLWPGLVQALQYNRHRQHERVRLFEMGLRFQPGDEALNQEKMLAGVVAGPAAPEQWGVQRREVDFFDVKADVEALMALTGEREAFVFEPASHPALHPGQSARILRGGEPVGWLGAIHPATAQQLELDGRAYVFELAVEALAPAALPAFAPLSKYPSIRRDLAVVVDDATPAAAVTGTIREAAGELLRSLVVFDVYRGKGVPEGCKSLAIGLILQETSRTLTDADVEEITQRVVGRLRSDHDATLRE